MPIYPSLSVWPFLLVLMVLGPVLAPGSNQWADFKQPSDIITFFLFCVEMNQKTITHLHIYSFCLPII